MNKFDDVLGCNTQGCTDCCTIDECDEKQPSVQEECTCNTCDEEDSDCCQRITLDETLNKDLIEEWYGTSSKISGYGDLMVFLQQLMNDYNHDYGTIVHVMTAGMMATMWVMNKDKRQGGITGFQASCLMWELIIRLLNKKGPMRLIEYEDLLYPQYDYKFDKVLSEGTFKWLQDQARMKLRVEDPKRVHADVLGRWVDITLGLPPAGFTVRREENNEDNGSN